MKRTSVLAAGFMVALLSLTPGASQAKVEAASTPKLQKFDASADFDYQLGGEKAVPASVKTVVRDRNASPLPGKYNVCYVNAFQTQPDEKSLWKKNSSLLLRKNGKLVNDGAWNETLLDIRTAKKRQSLANIVGRWIDKCGKDGFQAVEFDNLDSYTRSKGMVKRTHAVAYAKKLVARAHSKNLAAGQKNLGEWNGRQAKFDFAIAEECGDWKECGSYVKYYGSQVLMVEYTAKGFSWSCNAFGKTHPVVKRDLALSASYTPTFC